MKINATDKVITDLLAAWHEAARADYEESYPNSNYDAICAKTAKQGNKYINLDNGSCGVFMVDRETRQVYRVKGYGKIDKRKFAGTVPGMTAKYLEAVK